ncbi:hypothetical protein POPTR_016G093550v4 [Populus trichocarpa]|jgi:hypothetical protein|uniref:Uncharacterized protein n=1 Tax=Populus trichocarpa TaxID=3694 RepID=A0ACC0RTM3_POPTR|nr:hypothetical protein BDE02_16G085700 [Populus trichocarpa]KAI9380468.1 hypothetical protein POPTR_016G093550v4 [Populus trichocarpa]
MASIIDMNTYIHINNYIFLLFCMILTILPQFIFKKLTKATTNTKLHLPPSPPALPVTGHLHLFTLALYKCFYNLSSKLIWPSPLSPTGPFALSSRIISIHGNRDLPDQ